MPIFHDDLLVLVCADLQVEYMIPGRRHVILDGDAAILRCLELLALWRSNLWPVMHLKRVADAAWFDPSSRLTDWIAEARPRPGEMTFEHALPSAYSSSRFADHMSSLRNVRCVVTGFSLDETILATVVEGFHRSHRYRLVGDAVACRQPATGKAGDYKQSLMNVIGNFATVQSCAELIRTSGAVAV
ncbi:isochorismatase family protein [Bradyrhizobium guangzhouense]|uniref:Amidase n=1 Tax=Bradyrhizobium guangzhouense TaxID=1325095 RepID=A0AAE5X2B5_9BRAD|nr:isochorismatase family protein [Bradyrhizobium guangzhouense]QAU47430.1 amidase [Bradyrhizobium guangzhouense]RXH06826.1 isochorismatase family protein [Bradyrhizobium guangzhouense]RXH11872.1 isochorismatase family protein [Bradyrhizobium guangzhouense]